MAMNLAQTERNPVVVVGTNTDFFCDANIPIILRYGDPLVVSSKSSTLLSCNNKKNYVSDRKQHCICAYAIGGLISPT